MCKAMARFGDVEQATLLGDMEGEVADPERNAGRRAPFSQNGFNPGLQPLSAL
jgi:hypothetical protein